MSFPISNSSHSSFLSLGLHTLVLYFFVSISVLQIRTSIHFSQILHMFINTQHLFFSSRLISVCVTLSRSTHASKDDPVPLILWLSFRKGRGTRDQTANIRWIIKKKKRVPEKKIYFCFIDYVKVFDNVDHNKLENLKETGIPDHLT